MKSIDIIQFKCDLEGYIEAAELPMEVKRMVLSEILKKVSDKAYQEVLNQMKEKEKENGSTDKNEV